MYKQACGTSQDLIQILFYKNVNYSFIWQSDIEHLIYTEHQVKQCEKCTWFRCTFFLNDLEGLGLMLEASRGRSIKYGNTVEVLKPSVWDSSNPRFVFQPHHFRQAIYRLPVLVLLLLFSHLVMSDSATPWTEAHQAFLFTGLPRQKNWSGLPFPFSFSHWQINKNIYFTDKVLKIYNLCLPLISAY